ncbi:hypothetical protein Tco_0200615 [Tanacetum coccineum]
MDGDVAFDHLRDAFAVNYLVFRTHGIPADSLQTPIPTQPSSSRSPEEMVLDLEKAKDAQAKEIADLKKRVQRRVESSEDQENLVDDTDGRSDDANMFDIDDLHGDEVNVDMLVGTKNHISCYYKLLQTTTTTQAKGIVVQEPSEFRTPQKAQPSMIKDKGKGIMIEPEIPLKRKDQVAFDEDLARNLQAQLEAKIIEEEKLTRKQEEESNILDAKIIEEDRLERQKQEEANIALIES